MLKKAEQNTKLLEPKQEINTNDKHSVCGVSETQQEDRSRCWRRNHEKTLKPEILSFSLRNVNVQI